MKLRYLIALFLSLSFGLNHLIGKISNPEYTPFALLGVAKGGTLDEAYCYVPQINAVRFNKSISDWQAYEYRLGPKIQPMLGPIIFGKAAKLFGLENLYIIVDFIFPPLVFLSFYYLTKLISKNELLSILASLLLIGKEPLQTFVFKFGVSILKYRELDYFINYLHNLNRPLAFARFDSPQFSFILLVVGLITFFRAIRSRKLTAYLLTGLLFGLQWYVYSYYAIFLTLVLGAAGGLFLIEKKIQRFKLVATATIVLLATSSFYWLNYWQFVHLPQAMDFFPRVGRVDGRWFDTNSLWPLLFFIIILKLKPKFTFILSLLAACIVSLNLQLLTGFSVQHFHWQSVIVTPVIILTLIFLLSKLKNRFIFFPGISLIIALTLGIFYRNWLVAVNTVSAYSKDNKFEEAYKWVNQNIEPGAVIMTPSIETNFWLIIKTKAYIFSPHGHHSLAPTRELIDRQLLALKLFGIEDDFINEFFSFRPSPGIQPHTHESLDLSGYDYIFDSLSGRDIIKTEKVIAEARAELNSTQLSWKKVKKKYRLDYIWVGPSEKRLTDRNFSVDSYLIKVFDNKTIQIFQVVD